MEAGNQPDEGKAAVCRVILNREKLKYESDGTTQGTILKFDQFSWLWFAFVHGKYTRISDTPEQAMSIAEYKLKTAPYGALAHCEAICAQVEAGTFKGPLYDELTPDTLLYANLDIIPKAPIWADPGKFVVKIAAHSFYRA